MAGHIQKRATSVWCLKWNQEKLYDAKFKLMLIVYAEKMNCTADRKFRVTGSKNTNMEKTKAEAAKHEIHTRIFQWAQAQIFPRIKTGN
jgi:hypothetical protein